VKRIIFAFVVTACVSFVVPLVAYAQSATTGAIAGVVRDTTGAILPGVTIEAASPALIEKVRTVATDSEGQYKIVDLRPGTYSVTFSLTGFSTVKREGVELTTGFTATVNGELKVGSIEETVTITAASPLVDTQNVRTQNVISRTALETLPTAKSLTAYASLTVGATLNGAGGSPQDVGGNRAENYGEMMIHGGRSGDGKQTVDGMSYMNEQGTGGGWNRWLRPADAFIQEVTLTTGGGSAEYLTGGIQENVVPKEGGNTFKTYLNAVGTNGNFQSSNINDDLRARGLSAVGKVKQIYDIGGGIGGPIRRDRLWFYASARKWESQEYYTGVYFGTTLNTVGTPYVADTNRPAFFFYPYNDVSTRLTWQVAPKHKIATNQIYQKACQCGVTGGFWSGEALANFRYNPLYLGQYTYSYPASNRLIIEAGFTHNIIHQIPRWADSVSPDAISIQELTSGFVYNAGRFNVPLAGFADPYDDYGSYNGRASLSYVTGSHAFKLGLQGQLGRTNTYGHFVPLNPQGYPVWYNFRNGVPAQLVEFATPIQALASAQQWGIFAQDQWTLSRLTLNLGVRFDTINGNVPDQVRPGGVFVPSNNITGIDNVPNFTDLSPRLGVSYDVFGNGKTAVKASIGRYLASLSAGFAAAINPANALVTSTTRTWTDANGNFLPDCVLTSRAANGECGAIDNQAFGTVVPNTTWDKAVTEGFGNRAYNWQIAASIQHEIRPGLAANFGYFRTWFGNFTVTDNVLVTPADFTTFCLTAPVDSRLPNGGGYQICDLSDVNPAKFGQVQNVVKPASQFGDPQEIYNGVDATMNWRFGTGGLLMGGANVGRKLTQCVAPDAPVQFCRQVEPWRTQVKLAASYPIRWGISLSAVFQSIPGVSVAQSTAGNAAWVVPNAQLVPVLGRNLAAGPAGLKSVLLFSPVDLYEDRLTQLDLRVQKSVQFGRVRLQPKVDVYNLFNVATVLIPTSTYPGSFLRPQQILGGRLFKFALQADF
jgi:hypothetical protein